MKIQILKKNIYFFLSFFLSFFQSRGCEGLEEVNFFYKESKSKKKKDVRAGVSDFFH